MSHDFLYHLKKAMVAIRSTELGVSDDDLAEAPQLELWLPVRNQFGVLALWGQVTDHPTLGKDDIVTSPLVAWAPDDGWARSISRLYRLGQPFFALSNDLADQLGGKASRLIVEISGVRPVDNLDAANQLIDLFVAHVRKRADEVGEPDS